MQSGKTVNGYEGENKIISALRTEKYFFRVPKYTGSVFCTLYSHVLVAEIPFDFLRNIFYICSRNNNKNWDLP